MTCRPHLKPAGKYPSEGHAGRRVRRAEILGVAQRSACEATLSKHPTILNATRPLGGESLLQYAVRKKDATRVEMLLTADCQFGLIADPKVSSFSRA